MTPPYRGKPQVTIGTRDSIASGVAALVAELAQAAFAARGVVSIAIAGGSVAEACLPLLANAAIPWAATHLFWVDERAVPVSDPESNAGQAMELWAGSRLDADATVHPMPGAAASPDAAAHAYADDITRVAGMPPTLDVVLLGVGEDGHVASLFPGHASLADSRAVVLVECESPKPPALRLTLSLEAIANARAVLIVAFGAAKASVMREALNEPSSQLPVSLVMKRAARVSVWLDSAAAGTATRA
ncbi:MAG: 6-phosphogluconolactonase [Gemmatimonas sp.]